MRRYSRKKNSIKIFGAVTVLAAALFVASYYFTNVEHKGVVVARVNGQEIFQSDIEQKLRMIFESQGEEVKVPAIETLPREVLDVLIKEAYLDKELSKLAKRSSVANDPEVKANIAEIENKILRQAYIKAEVAKEVTDKKVSDKYSEISANLDGKKEFLLFHIVTKTKDEAEKLRKEITSKKKAIKFSDAAKKYSLDQESAERGGELGFVLEDNIIKEIGDVVVNLKQDEISMPIQTKFGWHLVKFTETREAKPLAFDAVKQNIREQLEQDKTNEIEAAIVKDVKVDLLIKSADEAKKEDEVKKDEPVKSEEIAAPAEATQDAAAVSTEQQPAQDQVQLEQQGEQKTEQQPEQKAEEAKSDNQKDEKSKEEKHSSKKHRK